MTLAVGLPEGCRTIVDLLPDAAMLFADDVLVHANPAAVHRLEAAELLGSSGGVDEVDLAAVDVLGLLLPPDRPVLAEALRSALAGLSVPTIRLRCAAPSGVPAVVSSTCIAVSLLGTDYVLLLVRDITAEVDAEVVAASSELRFRALFDHSPVGVALVERARFVLVNPALCHLLGRTADELLGKSVDVVTVQEDLALNRAVAELLDRGEVAHVQQRYLRPDGRVLWCELTAVRIGGHSADTVAGRTVVHLRDVTAQRQAAEQLRHAALHDPLTGLGNRTLLEDRLNHLLTGRDGERAGLAVLLVDLDGFKRINDALGHAAGDQVLQTVARRVRDAVRPADTVIRWGGDEFVVLLEGADVPHEAMRVVRRVEQAVEHGAHELTLTASVGVAFAPPGERPLAAELLQNADAAMYRAKRAGRNRHSVFDQALRDAASRRSHVEAVLRDAVERDRIVVHYQPLVDLRTRAVVGVEALLRLRDGDRLLLPAAFLDVAEESGAMCRIEQEVIRQACRQATEWVAAGHDLRLSVNVCARQVEQIEDFEALLHDVLADTGLAANRLVCEVTEHALLNLGRRTVAGVTRLADAGIEFSVDDFGTGYGSMTYLQLLPVREVKIDRRFVTRAAHDRPAAAIVRAVAGMAAELGMRCVAEGIEDELHHELALRLGAGLGQGYLYPGAALAAEVPRLLRHARTSR